MWRQIQQGRVTIPHSRDRKDKSHPGAWIVEDIRLKVNTPIMPESRCGRRCGLNIQIPNVDVAMSACVPGSIESKNASITGLNRAMAGIIESRQRLKVHSVWPYSKSLY